MSIAREASVAAREFELGAKGSAVEVVARSPVHDVRLRADRMTGLLRGDPAAIERGAEVSVTVPMEAFTSGDKLKDWKLASALDAARWPEAQFTLTALERAERRGDRYDLAGRGELRYRGHEASIAFEGEGGIEGDDVWAEVRFRLDMRLFGMKAPRFFVVKMDDTVDVTVWVRGRAGA